MTHLELMKDVFFVGYIDFEVRNFHGYSTHKGSSYNAYIVKSGEKTVLIDTVKRPYFEHFLENIKNVCNPSEINYFIVNHVEPDHSGSFPLILKYLPNAEIIASQRGKENLEMHFHEEVKKDIFNKIRAVKEGDTLDIGNGKKFTFVPIPMIHWPDSMVSFMTDDNGQNVLFSNDAFGQHFATSKRWDDENDLSEIMWEAEKYYANILLHLSGLIAKALPKVGSLPIDIICPSHGICWRTYIAKIVEAYKKWSAGLIDGKSVLIVYDTMWGSTEKIAQALYKEISHRGIRVKRYRLTNADYSDVITEAMKANAILVGSPTLNNGLYPLVAEYLSYQRGLKPMNKIGMAFGSYGWGGGAVKEIIKELEATGIDVMEQKIEVKFVPKPEDLDFEDIVDKLVEKMGKRRERIGF
ncbi:MAG: FprA family A-type flavoprotein [Candidatus Hodarchaeota archaeon]